MSKMVQERIEAIAAKHAPGTAGVELTIALGAKLDAYDKAAADTAAAVAKGEADKAATVADRERRLADGTMPAAEFKGLVDAETDPARRSAMYLAYTSARKPVAPAPVAPTLTPRQQLDAKMAFTSDPAERNRIYKQIVALDESK